MTRLEPLAQTVPALAAGGEVVEQPGHDGGFLQRPFVQNILPFLTSLSVHAGVVGLGLLAFTAITIVRHPTPMQDQVAAADMELTTDTGIPKFATDPSRLHIPTIQDQIPSETSGTSFTHAMELSAGGAPGAEPGSTFDFGPHASLSDGTGGGATRMATASPPCSATRKPAATDAISCFAIPEALGESPSFAMPRAQ
jgi:hypothetical protein